MNFSKPVSYAIRALVYLSRHGKDGPVLSSTIAKEESLPAPYLIKVLGTLTAGGFIGATRGRGGGFSLMKAPEDISLYDIYVQFEGLCLSQECLLGLGKCGDNLDCPVHDLWGAPRAQLEKFLRKTTISQLSKMKNHIE